VLSVIEVPPPILRSQNMAPQIHQKNNGLPG